MKFPSRVFQFDHELVCFLAQTLGTNALVAYPEGDVTKGVFVVGDDAVGELSLLSDDGCDIWRAWSAGGHEVFLQDPEGDIHRITERGARKRAQEVLGNG